MTDNITHHLIPHYNKVAGDVVGEHLCRYCNKSERDLGRNATQRVCREAVNAAGIRVLTPEEWEQYTGITILDADGWKHGSHFGKVRYEARPWHEPINYEEFQARAAVSTVSHPTRL